MPEALIVGGGVSGLSCGIRLLEAGYHVRIWARDLPLQTVSNVAAAVWYPFKAYPEHLVVGWSRTTYSELLRLLPEPSAGIFMRPGHEIFPWPVDEPWWREAVPSYRRIAPAELPQGYVDGYVFEAPVIEMPIYLRYLLARFERLGGSIEQRVLASLAPALAESALVVNCSGLGARELVGDGSVFPIRGQVVRVAQMGFDTFLLDDHGPGGITYIIPRGSDCVLGGTVDEGSEDMAADPATAAAIMARSIFFEPRLAQATVLEHKVGLRPGRPTVRLEAEQPAPGQRLIHNYGHGGAGVTLSWGCADEVARLAQV